MSSDAISKNKLVVQDDFFNEIVDGLKSPVEEKIETQDAKSSRVYLGGKQLALFKGKVAPLFGKEIGENKMVHDYVQHVSDSYEQKKIQKLHNDFIEAIKEYSEIERQADDEIDEMNEDKKGQSNFLFQGFRLFKTFHRIVKIYDMYKQMKAQLEPQNEKHTFDTFDINDYNLNDEAQRRYVVDQLTYRMNEESLKYVPTLRPLLRGITKSIFDVGQVAFRRINDAIYLEIMKIIGQFVGELGAATLFTFLTQGRGASAIGAVFAKFPLMVNRFLSLIGIGTKFVSLANSVYKMGRIGRGTVRVARSVGNVFRQMTRVTKDEMLNATRYILEHRRTISTSIKLINAGLEIYDIIDVDDEDLNAIRRTVIEKTEQSRIRVESDMQMFANDLVISQEALTDVSTAFRSIPQRKRQSIGNLKLDNEGYLYVSDIIQNRYSSEIRIKNLNFDFEKFNTLSEFFKGEYISNFEIDMHSFYTKDGNKYKFNGTSIIYNSGSKKLEWISSNTNLRFNLSREYILYRLYFIDNETYINDIENTSYEICGSYRNWESPPRIYGGIVQRNEIREKGNFIRIRQTEVGQTELQNDVGTGVLFQYGTFGVVTGLKIYLEFNSGFLKYIDSDGNVKNHNDEWMSARRIASLCMYGNTAHSYYMSNYIQQHSKKYLFLNGQKVNKIVINGQELSINNEGDYIGIQGLRNILNQYTISKRDKNGNIIEIKTYDFSEVLINRKDILHEENKFNEKITKLWEKVNDVIDNREYDKMREAAIKAIKDFIERIEKVQDSGNITHRNARVVRTYSDVQMGDNTVRGIIEKLSSSELDRINNATDDTILEEILIQHGVKIEHHREETNTPTMRPSQKA